MASSESLLQGYLPRICAREFDLGSSCTRRTLADVLNLAFLLVYFLILLVAFLRRQNTIGNRTRGWLFRVASACCAATGIGNLIAAVFSAKHGIEHYTWLAYSVEGLIWAAMAVSLNIHETKTLGTLVILWWLSSSILISVLNIKAMVNGYGLPVLDMITWPANLLLLFCALKLMREYQLSQHTQKINLSGPLLTEKCEIDTEFGKATFLSKLTFSWLNPLMRLGHSKPLVLNDIPPLDTEDAAPLAYQAFALAWEQEREDKPKKKNLVFFSLGRCYLKEMLLIGLYAFLKTVSTVVSPILLYALVKFSNQKAKSLYWGMSLVMFMVFTKIVESLSQRHWFFNSRRYGMRMRSALMAAVFGKMLELSSSGRRRHSAGEIVNYIAVDAYSLGEFPWCFHMAWSLPLQLLLSIAVLFWTVGLGALPGLVPLIICGVLNIPFGKMLQDCQSNSMVAQDERLRATSEVLNNMKIIKLQSWEESFRRMIQSLRDMEFKWLAEIQINKSYGTALYWISPTVVAAVIFAGTSIMRTAPLDASTIFTILATLRLMADPVRTLPQVLSRIIQIKVSLDRLDVFLLEDEIKEDGVKRNPLQNADYSVKIEEGCFSWDPSAISRTIKSINLNVQRGEKVAVVGHVGAGKSSLLCAILGEIPQLSGSIECGGGSIAFVPQTSWIQSGTIRDNILFGKSMNKTSYEKAIKCCALDQDINSFDYGDLTEIGHRGLNLSGGQKQRVQLARAVYSDADIYLLDDPFSAVDAHTAAILFKECIMVALQKKTVILVTHQIEFLAETDKILVMESGQITQAGTYEELLRSGMAFQQLANAHQSAKVALDSVYLHGNETSEEIKIQNDFSESQPIEKNEGETSVEDLSAVQLTEDEETEIGDVGWKPYKDYIHVAKGCTLFTSFVLSQSIVACLQILSFYWLAIAIQMRDINQTILITVYAVVSVLTCLFAFIRSLFATYLGLKASKELFCGFMDSVFKAPMLFFDSTPVGRILTRASSDMSIVDFDIPYSMMFALGGWIEMIATIVIMAIVTWPVVIVTVPVIIVVVYLQRYYQASARELARINGTTKAPLTNYAAETLLGVATIRAYATMERFFNINLQLVDTDATLFFHTIASTEWILVRVETFQNLIILVSAVSLVLIPNGTISPGFIGLSLACALALTSIQVFVTRWCSVLENSIISIERIKQYMHIQSEPPAIIDEKRPPPSWPHEGRIQLSELKIQYRPNAPVVLKGITCTFMAGEKIGVVGRTGSGKTTLISALFRLVEPVGGKILIDDLDICTIGLKDLRMKLSIIPQEPTLFRGSVRSNLDPLGQYTDHEIWEAIEKCQLKTTISNLPSLLDSPVSDDGENWSTGQRQLFCLGRVLLRKNKILVLDEATASIDSATDAILQKIIRQEFSNCTVITVAHRVPTVADSDKVMVLSYGNIVEFGIPKELLKNKESYFSKLVAEYWSNCGKNSNQDPTSYQGSCIRCSPAINGTTIPVSN